MTVSRSADALSHIDVALEPDGWRERLATEPDEALPVLYDYLRSIRERAWMCMCLIVAEMTGRARGRAAYGQHVAEDVAAALGCSASLVHDRARIATEILSDPESVETAAHLGGETWCRVALRADDPKAALREAAGRKDADPTYSARRFAEELSTRVENQEPLTVSKIILVCQGTAADSALAARISDHHGIPTELALVAEVVGQMTATPGTLRWVTHP